MSRWTNRWINYSPNLCLDLRWKGQRHQYLLLSAVHVLIDERHRISLSFLLVARIQSYPCNCPSLLDCHGGLLRASPQSSYHPPCCWTLLIFSPFLGWTTFLTSWALVHKFSSSFSESFENFASLDTRPNLPISLIPSQISWFVFQCWSWSGTLLYYFLEIPPTSLCVFLVF